MSLPQSSAELVTVRTYLASTPIPAGQSVEAVLMLNVQDGWHVNAHRPTYDYLIGTKLRWDTPPGGRPATTGRASGPRR